MFLVSKILCEYESVKEALNQSKGVDKILTLQIYK